jgi:hypothetical protein
MPFQTKAGQVKVLSVMRGTTEEILLHTYSAVSTTTTTSSSGGGSGGSSDGTSTGPGRPVDTLTKEMSVGMGIHKAEEDLGGVNPLAPPGLSRSVSIAHRVAEVQAAVTTQRYVLQSDTHGGADTSLDSSLRFIQQTQTTTSAAGGAGGNGEDEGEIAKRQKSMSQVLKKKKREQNKKNGASKPSAPSTPKRGGAGSGEGSAKGGAGSGSDDDEEEEDESSQSLVYWQSRELHKCMLEWRSGPDSSWKQMGGVTFGGSGKVVDLVAQHLADVADQQDGGGAAASGASAVAGGGGVPLFASSRFEVVRTR